LEGASFLERPALPAVIADLCNYQAFELREQRWKDDLSVLLRELEGLGFQRQRAGEVRYPTPRITLKELSETELVEALKQLSGWQVQDTAWPGHEPRRRTELHRAFEFASFDDAIGFMVKGAPIAEKLQHHPRWENLWRTVSVSLCTWDIGQKVSRLDVDLAVALTRVREEFPPAKPRRAG
jgi:pterin-4a-carbinolamine dehydratase